MRPLRTGNLRPFLRWVGGKARLVHVLRTLVPPIGPNNVYFEPFLGAGSLFFAVQPAQAVLGDRNRALVECFKKIQSQPYLLWRHLRPYLGVRGSKAYYMARDEFNRIQDSYKKAALFIYLNKTSFNGIWRLNKKGGFNVPYGGKESPAFPTLGDLKTASAALYRAKIRCADFEETVERAIAGDFVYIDPPYPPLNGTAYFTHYTKERFRISEQNRVAALFKKLDKRGCTVMVSNADLPLIRDLYKRYRITELPSQRCVASHGRRYQVRDLVITNYKT